MGSNRAESGRGVKPKDFSIEKWLKLATEKEVFVAPINWKNAEEMVDLFGKNRNTMQRKVKFLEQKGLIIKHRVGQRIYYELIMKEKNEL
jgi:hypothetical protein